MSGEREPKIVSVAVKDQHGTIRPHPDIPAIKWEYMFETMPMKPEGKTHLQRLNEWGDQGWELVSTVSSDAAADEKPKWDATWIPLGSDRGYWSWFHLTFKRAQAAPAWGPDLRRALGPLINKLPALDMAWPDHLREAWFENALALWALALSSAKQAEGEGSRDNLNPNPMEAKGG